MLPTPAPATLGLVGLLWVAAYGHLVEPRPDPRRRFRSWTCCLLALLAGILAVGAALQPAPLLRLQDHRAGLRGPWRVRGVLDGAVEPTATGSLAALTVTAVRVDGVWRPWGGRLRLRVRSAPPGWDGGDAVEGRIRLRADRPPRNPGSPSGPRLRLRGFDAEGRLHAWGQLRRLSAGGGRTGRLRGRLRRTIGELFPERTPLLRALILGERSDLPGEITDDLARSGLVHLIAVSGLHVGLLLGALVVAARALGASSRLVSALGLGALAVMAVVVIPRAPIRRALIMGGLLLGGRIAGLRLRAVDALGASVLCATLGDPAAVGALDLQLSGVATMGILLLPSVPFGVGLLTATLAAQAAVAPLLARQIGAVPLAGLGLNLVAAPLLAGGLVLAVAAVLLGLGGAGPATALATAADTLLGGVLRLTELGELLAPLPVHSPGWGGTASWGLALAATLAGRRRIRALGIVALAALAAVALRPPPAPSPSLYALDVGQGDALLVRSPGGDVLIDAGGYPGIDYDTGAAIVAPALRHLGVRRLQAVAGTHGHADHIGGIPAILRRFPAGALWIGANPATDLAVSRLLDTARRRGVPALAAAGSPVAASGCDWRSLDPGLPRLLRGARKVDNDASLALLARCGRRSLLLTGDAGVRSERAWGAPVPTGALLKVGHHGSDTSTGPALLDAVRPRHAVISVGARNPFGLPRRRVVDRLRDRGIAVYRTDRDGALEVRIGRRIRVRGWRWRTGG